MKEKKTFIFDKKTRTWELAFRGWDTKDRVVQFEFEKSVANKSWTMIENDLRRGINIGIYSYENGARGDLLTTIRVDIPNLWPEEDPHKIYTNEQVDQLIRAIVRDAHGEFLTRLADGWRNYEAERTSAFDFNFEYKKEENNESVAQ